MYSAVRLSGAWLKQKYYYNYNYNYNNNNYYYKHEVGVKCKKRGENFRLKRNFLYGVIIRGHLSFDVS